MTRGNKGFSLVELMVVLSVLGVLTIVIVPRVFGENDATKAAACHTYQGVIEIQAELWMHNTGNWPSSNLADIGASTDYFPEGLPTCPVDGSAYTIDNTGRVVGHSH